MHLFGAGVGNFSVTRMFSVSKSEKEKKNLDAFIRFLFQCFVATVPLFAKRFISRDLKWYAMILAHQQQWQISLDKLLTVLSKPNPYLLTILSIDKKKKFYQIALPIRCLLHSHNNVYYEQHQQASECFSGANIPVSFSQFFFRLLPLQPPKYVLITVNK